MSPAENKMFHAAAFNFPNIDPSALLGAYEQRAQLTAQLITQLTDRPTNAITLFLSPSAHTWRVTQPVGFWPTLGLNTQLQQSGDLAVSPQGESEHFSIRTLLFRSICAQKLIITFFTSNANANASTKIIYQSLSKSDTRYQKKWKAKSKRKTKSKENTNTNLNPNQQKKKKNESKNHTKVKSKTRARI